MPLWTLLPALTLVLIYSLRQRPARRNVLLLTAFSGLVGVFAMINFTQYHEFTTMYALGFALVFWLALLGRIRRQSTGSPCPAGVEPGALPARKSGG